MGELTCDNANDLARFSPSAMVIIDQRFVIPGTRMMRADSPASRVPVASAFVSSRMMLESWFPNATMSHDNTSVYQGPPACDPQSLLTLDSRGTRTTTTQRVWGLPQNHDWVGTACDEVLINHPDCVAAPRLEVTANKSTNSLLATRYCTMPRDVCGPSWSLFTDDATARRSWQVSVRPRRCSDLACAPNNPLEEMRHLRLKCAFLAYDHSQDKSLLGGTSGACVRA